MEKRNLIAVALRTVVMISLLLSAVTKIIAQTVSQQLQKTFQQFQDDSQLKYAMSSLYVIEAKTGKVIFDKNSRVGMAAASTQKIITSVSAFEILSKEYRYKTSFVIKKDAKSGQPWLFVYGSGDPTFGSWRYQSTKDSLVLRNIITGLKGIVPFTIAVQDNSYGTSAVPDGYIWQDMGNYYGSGHYQLSWRENQYDIAFNSTGTGDTASLARVTMDTAGYHFINKVTSGAAGSGDNAYIYSSPLSRQIYVTGTIPPNQKRFTISGADPNPPISFANSLSDYIQSKRKGGDPKSILTRLFTEETELYESVSSSPRFTRMTDTAYIHYSPSLDSIIYWFNKKSVNLYGEALLKAMAASRTGVASTDSGVSVVQQFWKQKGLDENELNIADGSGLSPGNRITTHVQVEILKYARGKEWFSYFYNALPEYNGMKMKSGTIGGVKGFCGYQKAADGTEYIFSFLVNNYNGPAGALVNKMYKVLDQLK